MRREMMRPLFQLRMIRKSDSDPRAMIASLIEVGEVDLDEALDDLVESICDCRRWPLAEQWERTHPPHQRRRR